MQATLNVTFNSLNLIRNSSNLQNKELSLTICILFSDDHHRATIMPDLVLVISALQAVSSESMVSHLLRLVIICSKNSGCRSGMGYGGRFLDRGLDLALTSNLLLRLLINLLVRWECDDDGSMKLGMASALETLFGQAFGAKKYNTMGVYMQRSWIVLFVCAVLLLPMYMFATPVLKLLGQPDDVAKLSGSVAIWMIPLHFAFAFQFPLQRFLQSQLKTGVIAWVSMVALIFHVFVSWLFVYKLHYGLIGTAVTLNFSWWFLVFGLFAYTVCGGCPLSWNGFSTQAFSGLWDFVKLSAASGVMICLENWYYRILILMTGSLKDAKIAVDALSVCQNINGLEMMIPLAFFAGTGVRVSNELGAGNGKAAKFATTVSVVTSLIIGLLVSSLIMVFHDKFALIYTSSAKVINAVDRLGVLLAFTILLNSIQPVLSGVAVGSGWQGLVAYINIGSYYIIGLPLGILFGLTFHFGVMGIWSGMIGGTVVQTVILAIITIRCDWEKEAERVRSRMMKLATGNDGE